MFRSIRPYFNIGNKIKGISSSYLPLRTAFCYSTNVTPNEYANSSSNFSIESRRPGKHNLSRKTFLIDYYKYLNDNNEILLYTHHNNMTKQENKRFRSELKKVGSQLNVIRNSIYKVYLRSENEIDPADAEISRKNKDVEHPAFPLFNGPTAIISIPTCNPAIVADVLRVLRSAQEKLILIGAKIDQKTFNIDDVNQFKDLPTKEQLQSQLTGLLTILSGAGLVKTLESGSNVLYLTLKEHVKNNEEN